MIRRFCALAAVLGLLLQGSVGGHMALVEHTRCHEHGELEHGPAAHGLSLDARVAFAAIAGRTDSSSEGGCDHCALSANRRDAGAFLTKADVPGASLLRDEAAPFDCPRIAFETERHRLAPKNSPPA